MTSELRDSLAQVQELKPCPWCGEKLTSVSVSEGSTFRWRKVDGCCTDGPEVRHDTMADDQAAAEIDSTRRAIAAWNHRYSGGDADRSAELTTAWMAGVEREREREAEDSARLDWVLANIMRFTKCGDYWFASEGDGPHMAVDPRAAIDAARAGERGVS